MVALEMFVEIKTGDWILKGFELLAFKESSVIDLHRFFFSLDGDRVSKQTFYDAL